MEWDADGTVSQSERDVPNHLQPHTNLKRLVINDYGGTSFLNWVGDCSFSKITVSLKVLIPINWLINPRIFM